MAGMSRGSRIGLAAFVAAGGLLLGGCHLDLSARAEARDQWQRHYTVTQGGSLEIRNVNGTITIEQGADDSIDVTAERIVKAFNDDAAKDALAKMEIKESVSPDHVMLDSNTGGMSINLQREVNYHVRGPQWLNLKLRSTNGTVDLTGDHWTGKFDAESTNGRISARGLENTAHVDTTNGRIALEINKLGADGVDGSTTNGTITVTVPPTIAAQFSARVSNGAINTEGVQVAVSEQTRHRLDGKINGGGPAIKLETTNGSVTLKAR